MKSTSVATMVFQLCSTTDLTDTSRFISDQDLFRIAGITQTNFIKRLVKTKLKSLKELILKKKKKEKLMFCNYLGF